MKKNVILEKSYKFSLEILSLYKSLTMQKEFVLSKQILRSGTSIGANIHEAQGSISRKEFIMKMQIGYKELLETEYWLNLLKDSELIREEAFKSFESRVIELKRILVSIQKTSK